MNLTVWPWIVYANMNEKKCLVWISETRKRNISWESVIYIIMQYTIWQNLLFEHFLSNMFDTISKLNKILFYIWYIICIPCLFASLKGTSVSFSIQSVQNHCKKRSFYFLQISTTLVLQQYYNLEMNFFLIRDTSKTWIGSIQKNKTLNKENHADNANMLVYLILTVISV